MNSLRTLINSISCHLDFSTLPFEQHLCVTLDFITILSIGTKKLEHHGHGEEEERDDVSTRTNVFLSQMWTNRIEDHIEGTWNETGIIQRTHHCVRLARTSDAIREQNTCVIGRLLW